MKITKSQLKKIIQEELGKVLNEIGEEGVVEAASGEKEEDLAYARAKEECTKEGELDLGCLQAKWAMYKRY